MNTPQENDMRWLAIRASEYHGWREGVIMNGPTEILILQRYHNDEWIDVPIVRES